MGEITEFRATYTKVNTGNYWLILGPILGWMIFEFISLFLISSTFPEYINIIGVFCLFGGFILFIPISIFVIIYARKSRNNYTEQYDILAKFFCQNTRVIYMDNDAYIRGEVLYDPNDNFIAFYISKGNYISIKDEDKGKFLEFLDINEANYEKVLDE